MAKGMYFKLAKGNLLRNKRMYLPFFIATVLISGMFFIIFNLVFSESISNMSYGGTTRFMLLIGLVVMSLFTVGYMLYINSFLIKRRKNEFGLYGILGLEKRHVVRIIRTEGRILNYSALLGGLISGIVFGRLIFMLLMALMDVAKGSVYSLSPWAFAATIFMFLVIFWCMSIYNAAQVRLANPITLMSGEGKAEKPVRGVIPTAIAGFIIMAGGYAMAILSRQPAVALGLFWPAVILVIIGTWLLFIGGTAFVLRCLKRNKRFYYKPRNFIAVSGLIYRLKQNAAGLANICILSTMVLVTMACCTALFFGGDSVVKRQNPNDIQVVMTFDEPLFACPNQEAVIQAVEDRAKETSVVIEQMYTYRSLHEHMLIYDNGDFGFRSADGRLQSGMDELRNRLYAVRILPAADYQALTGDRVELGQNETLILCCDDIGARTSFTANGSEYAVLGTVTDSLFTTGKNSDFAKTIFFVVRDEEAAYRLKADINPHVPEQGEYVTAEEYMVFAFVINAGGDSQDLLTFSEELPRKMYLAMDYPDTETSGYNSASIFQSAEDSNSTYGGLMFLGAFFTILFIINTVLIIYFKQVSEGFDDRERFHIMQQVGMSDSEVKHTINRQVLIVFFLPLVTALVHIAAASNMLIKMLMAFQLYDVSVTMSCIGITALLFTLVYIVVYRLTAKTYYKIVKW